MRKIFISDYYSTNNGESAERIYVYQIDNEDEFWEFEKMSYSQKCDYFNVIPTIGYAYPGSVFYSYDFFNTTEHIIMTETKAFNI